MIDSVCRLPYWISPILRPTRSSKAACSDYARAHQSVGVLNGRKHVICRLLKIIHFLLDEWIL